MRDDDTCLLAECQRDVFANLMWVHKTARNHLKWFTRTDRTCSCYCKTPRSLVRSCKINDSLIVEQEQEHHGCKGNFCMIKAKENKISLLKTIASRAVK